LKLNVLIVSNCGGTATATISGCRSDVGDMEGNRGNAHVVVQL